MELAGLGVLGTTDWLHVCKNLFHICMKGAFLLPIFFITISISYHNMWLPHCSHSSTLSTLQLQTLCSYYPNQDGMAGSSWTLQPLHTQWIREICLNLAKETTPSLPKLSSAYFSPCTKNVLAKVKSDNSLKYHMSNNQKLIQDN